MRRFFLAAFFIFFASVIFHLSSSSASIYDDEARVSGALQGELQSQFDAIFGKNAVSVLLKVEFAIDPEIRDAVKKAFLEFSKPPAPAKTPPPEPVKAAQPEFLWGTKKADPAVYILPGFEAKPGAQARRDEGSDRPVVKDAPVLPGKPDTALVLAAGTMIRKISVKLSISDQLPLESVATAKSIATAFLNLNPQRGDVLSVERVSLPSAWNEVLRNPEMLFQIAQKILLSGSAIIIAVLLVLGVLFLARTIRRSTATIANAVSEGMKNRDLGGRLGPEVQELPEGTPPAALTADEKGSKFQLDVGLHQVKKLHHLLHREPPENIALVLSHLNLDVRQSFMSLLPKDVAAQVLTSLASVLFLEPEVIAKLKEELEYRLQGTVGGVEQAVDIMKNSDTKTRYELMEILKQKNPDLAQAIRKQIFFFEDVFLLGDAELRQLVAAAPMLDISLAFVNSEEWAVERVQQCLDKKTQAVLRKNMSLSSGQSEDKVLEAQDRVILQLYGLVQQGKVKHPLSRTAADAGNLIESKTDQ